MDDFGFPHRNKPLGMCPQPAPFTVGSRFVDSNYPPEARFTVYRYESNDFGEMYLFDLHNRWHEPEDCRVVEYLSPEALEQRKQDLILARLEQAYELA
jgi:hypothetical protein